MDNLKRPASPLPVEYDPLADRVQSSDDPDDWGFTKLEKAALMIASGMVRKVWEEGITTKQSEMIAIASRLIAKAVLEEANK